MIGEYRIAERLLDWVIYDSLGVVVCACPKLDMAKRIAAALGEEDRKAEEDRPERMVDGG